MIFRGGEYSNAEVVDIRPALTVSAKMRNDSVRSALALFTKAKASFLRFVNQGNRA